MRTGVVQLFVLLAMLPTRGWSRMNWDTTPTAKEAGLQLKICVGPAGGIYHRAAQVFADHLVARMDVQYVYTKGALGNLEGLRNGDCDLAFTRSNAIDFVNSEQTSNAVSGTLQLRALDDGQSDDKKNPAETLMSNELFREYTQLVCHRELGITEVADLYGAQKNNADRLYELRQVEQALNQAQAQAQHEMQLGNKTGGHLWWKHDYAKELPQLNSELPAVRAKIESLEGTRPFEVIIVNEGDEQIQVSQTAFRNLGDVTWAQLTKAAPQYASIRTRVENGQPGLSPSQVGLLLLKNNPNACFLSVDRLGTDKEITALQVADQDPAVARTINLVNLDDGDFSGTTIQGLPIYESVNLEAKNILHNLRAIRPDGSDSWWANLPILSHFYSKRVRKVETLAIRTMLVANQTWYDNGKVYKDPVLMDAVREGIKDIKARFQDPAVK